MVMEEAVEELDHPIQARAELDHPNLSRVVVAFRKKKTVVIP